MDKSSLKKVIKPLIKECLQEILVEEGFMRLVKENLNTQQPIKTKQASYEENEKQFLQKSQNPEDKKISLQEAKNKLLKEIGMTGFDPFDGSLPLQRDDNEEYDLQEDLNPKNKIMPGIQGSGVNISGLMNANKQAWNFYNKVLNKGEKE